MLYNLGDRFACLHNQPKQARLRNCQCQKAIDMHRAMTVKGIVEDHYVNIVFMKNIIGES